MKGLKKYKDFPTNFQTINIYKMTKEKRIKLLVPVGLLMATLITNRFMHVTENVEDFFKGMGITMMICSFILQNRKQEYSKQFY